MAFAFLFAAIKAGALGAERPTGAGLGASDGAE